MIVRIQDFKAVCSKILSAVDSSQLSVVTETLELRGFGNVLQICVTNREYFVEVKLKMDENIDFHATVNADKFLKLVSQITTETITLTTNESTLIVEGNGVYRLPLIFDGTKLLNLPKININNVTKSFNVDSSVLNSILKYNSKQVNKNVNGKPIQKMYYVDNFGAITFTDSACVNNFALSEQVKLLFNSKIVKLFKLFDSGEVRFEVGYDNVGGDVIQTKVRFYNDDIIITAILFCDDSMLKSFPVEAIRNRANTTYDDYVTINRNSFLQSINRLLIFSSNIQKPYCKFEFNRSELVITDINNGNKEEIYYDTEVVSDGYSTTLDLTDIKGALESYTDQCVNFKFGDNIAVVITNGTVSNVIPEMN